MEADNTRSASLALIVKRGRLGNFQFRLQTEIGWLDGTVTVRFDAQQTPADAEAEARRKILALAETLMHVTELKHLK